MKQRALTFGVLSNPYRAIEAGQEFDYPTPLKWAERVDDKPAKASGGKKAEAKSGGGEPAEPGGGEPDPI